ncbi:2'-5' RNA ligase [Meinhardsimonia xiamenensis]|jgi:2'-5' RNA ligase|uniref:RNA 2',3'-cyclic phosphodiesterase n=1 Tax=Meinhardsimonia xiamenensis TaxID=990712 RepID=A0A1G9E4P9_9RHOB|nr:RNA 2',3'-cyclic phosphodiesterase [Meinhardsimonia xiamenensis]PRX33927.1 2'-5' RNA ligase [Meinhardsimonia xiamenensis]SDK71062.1 2'-5' RNA ligase [Meinhardsimonia xiamenensis]
MRSFIAVDLPEELREALMALQREIPVGRIMDPETLHLTLAFLGDVPEPVLAELDEELAAIRTEPLTLKAAGLGTFGEPEPFVLWARVEPTPELERLQAAVRRAAERAGLRLKRERFRPHVTLARFRHPGPGELRRLGQFLQSHGAVSLPEARALSFGLYRSHLRPDGAVHEPLAVYPLR